MAARSEGDVVHSVHFLQKGESPSSSGLRYCSNSAVQDFAVPLAAITDMEK